MKCILLTVLTLLLCLAAGYLLAALFSAHRKRHGRPPMRLSHCLLLGILTALLLMTAIGLICLLP